MTDEEIASRVHVAADALNAELEAAHKAGLHVDLGACEARVVEHWPPDVLRRAEVAVEPPGVSVKVSRPLPKPSGLREKINRAYRDRAWEETG